MAIITISREMGSGGIPIAHRAAEKLGYTLVDGEALRKVAGNYGLSQEAFDAADEHPPAFVAEKDVRLLVDLHQIELMILDYALKGDVIIYGRGGQDLLEKIKSVYLSAKVLGEKFGIEYHVDHIVPLSSFDLTFNLSCLSI